MKEELRTNEIMMPIYKTSDAQKRSLMDQWVN